MNAITEAVIEVVLADADAIAAQDRAFAAQQRLLKARGELMFAQQQGQFFAGTKQEIQEAD